VHARVRQRALDEGIPSHSAGPFERLTRRPRIGRTRRDLTGDRRIRFWAVGPSLIAYRLVDDEVEVLLVERGERDWEKLLGDD